MGNQVSSNSNRDEPNNGIKHDTHDPLNMMRDNYSSYKGVRTESVTSRQSITGSNLSIQKTDKTTEQQEQKIITPFERKEGGEIER